MSKTSEAAIAEAVVAEAVIAEALSWCGTPYRHQASVKGVGTDCLGLLRGVYRALYGCAPQTPPPYRRFGQAGEAELLLQAAETHLRPADAAQAIAGGEVLLFRLRLQHPARHVGIAVSGDRMVHALSGAQVCAVRLTPWWHRHCVARFAFPPLPEHADE